MLKPSNKTNSFAKDCLQGIRNLVDECMGVRPGDRVLLVLEPEGQLFYDADVSNAIEAYLTRQQAVVTQIRPTIISRPEDFPEDLARAMGGADHTLFLSRVGDYLRFTPMMGDGVVTINYARKMTLLDSPYAALSYTLMSQLHGRLEQELTSAKRWKIQCPLGTDLSGEFDWPSLRGGRDDDFTMKLFPVSTFKPVPGPTANGIVALSRWMMPSAGVKVGPEAIRFDDTVFAKVHEGVLASLDGDEKSVKKIERYVSDVSTALGVTETNIHSWHAGINPLTFFSEDVDQNLKAWGAISFGSPRYLHFHTAGKTPPGEITWSIFNASVWIDDQCFWRDGEFCWLQRSDNKELIRRIDSGHLLFEKSADIGV